jgi:hypothetical protein
MMIGSFSQPVRGPYRAQLRDVKRRVKRTEARAVCRETRARIMVALLFILLGRSAMGKSDLKLPFVSRCTGIDVKCETRAGFVKRG